jgi:hypothetical protein
MKLTIDNKIFSARYNDKNELIISLDNENDITFFKLWQNERNPTILKKDYVKNISVTKKIETGILYNCFPILNKNENEVQIVYDFYGDKILITQ